MAPDSETRLWSDARKGSRTAFATLFDLHAPALYRFAARLLGPGPDAEDAVQEVLLSVLERNGFDPVRGSLKTYLLGAVRNQARKRRGVCDEELPETLESPDVPPDLAFARDQTAAAIAEAVAALPWTQREVLLLFHFEDLCLKEIADTLHLDLAAVKSRLHRARQTLRLSLQPLNSRKGESR